MACRVEHDGTQTVYTIEEDKPRKPLTRDKRGYEAINGWWVRCGKGDSFLIRQENDRKADVVELSQRQVYDLIDALNRAIGLPQRPLRIPTRTTR